MGRTPEGPASRALPCRAGGRGLRPAGSLGAGCTLWPLLRGTHSPPMQTRASARCCWRPWQRGGTLWSGRGSPSLTREPSSCLGLQAVLPRSRSEAVLPRCWPLAAHAVRCRAEPALRALSGALHALQLPPAAGGDLQPRGRGAAGGRAGPICHRAQVGLQGPRLELRGGPQPCSSTRPAAPCPETQR